MDGTSILGKYKINFNKKQKFTNHWAYEIENLGYKYNMNDFMASVGLVQLKKLINNKRRNLILKKYLKGIKITIYNTTYTYFLKTGSY